LPTLASPSRFFGVVVIATVLAFGFGASLEIVVAILVLGVTTAIVEKELRAKN
jgi:hypothetical protein